MHVLQLGYLIDVKVETSELLTLLQHEGRNLSKQVIGDDKCSQVRAVLKATLYSCYFVHRNIQVDEKSVWCKRLNHIDFTELLVLDLDLAAHLTLGCIKLQRLPELAIRRHCTALAGALNDPKFIKLLHILR